MVLQSKSNPGTLKLAATCCHDRFCLPCGKQRSAVIAANIAKYLTKARLRFMTLTLRGNSDSLAAKLDKLYSCFKRLKKTDLWKRTQKGGAAFLEVKRSKDNTGWHPHLHIISAGNFIEAAHLSHAWKQITGDSFIVDVRAVKNPNEAIAYVTKYASKPFHPSIFLTHDTTDEAVAAMHGRRMLMSYGNWKGLQMTEKPTDDAWIILDSLDNILALAADGDPRACKIVSILIPADRQTMLLDLAYRKPRSPPPAATLLRDRQLDLVTLPSYP